MGKARNYVLSYVPSKESTDCWLHESLVFLLHLNDIQVFLHPSPFTLQLTHQKVAIIQLTHFLSKTDINKPSMWLGNSW